MVIKVGINGFGRIGRQVVKTIRERYPNEIDIVAFNDLGDLKTMAHLFRYDSAHGKFNGTVEVKEGALVIDGDEIKALSIRNPEELPWGELGVDIVVESTGIFTDKAGASRHLTAGAKKVIISAPAKGEDLTIVLGVNNDKYDPANHHVISNASCTTNCLAPAAKVVNDKYGIINAFMTTIAKAVALVIPELKGKFDGMAVRVPTITGSLVDFVATVERAPSSKEELIEAFEEAAAGSMKGILDVSHEPLVSVDYIGNPFSSIIDVESTSVSGNLVKVITWYDNEWGYSSRCADLVKFMGDKL
jgi:glyceraldehyde 3-phosphate dehydrogenase